MFRAAVLSIVVALGVGPSAALICQTVCHPVAQSAAGCQHEGSNASPTLGVDRGCSRDTSQAFAYLREDARRQSDKAASHHAFGVPRFAWAPSTRAVRFIRAGAWHLLHDTRPPVLALRL